MEAETAPSNWGSGRLPFLMVTCMMPVESLTTAKTIFPLLRVRYIQPLRATCASETGDLRRELMLVNEDI